jgi:aspartyl-tRNA(Asn)/glutamyl-tRNA(Gln) amidotransferase subunit A
MHNEAGRYGACMTAGPCNAPLTVLAARLRDGSTDPVTLTEAALAAIDASQPVLNAFVTVDHDGARAAARTARDEQARGIDRGPLHGIPVAVKDIVDVAGVRATMGSRHFADHVPSHDATVVTRLRHAGAVITGKTTTHEFAFGPTGDRTANGPATNPHDPTRMAGGSSAGSAAAVAAGLVALAVGTDTGGSVRIPAALCGTVGIRPSLGRIPDDGVFPLSWTLDSVGVLAGDVAATALGWHVLAGLPRPDPAPLPPLAGLRIGLPADAWFDRLDGTVEAAFEALVARLRSAGAQFSSVPVPDAAQLSQLYRTAQLVEALSIHQQRLADAPELFDPEVRQRLELAVAVSAPEYAVVLREISDARAGAAARLSDVDILLLPTVPILAPPVGVRDTDLGGGWTSPRDALLSHTALWGVLGLPALSVPVAADAPLPVGAQLVGGPGGDERLLDLARAVETLASPTGQA